MKKEGNKTTKFIYFFFTKKFLKMNTVFMLHVNLLLKSNLLFFGKGEGWGLRCTEIMSFTCFLARESLTELKIIRCTNVSLFIFKIFQLLTVRNAPVHSPFRLNQQFS